MEDEEVTSAPNHLLWTEDEDGMTHFSCRATGGCLLVVLLVLAVIIAVIVWRHT